MASTARPPTNGSDNEPGRRRKRAPSVAHLAPKTEASLRTVPLPRIAIDALARHIESFPPGRHGLIFTDGDGDPVRRTAFSVIWQPAARAAGLERGVGVHALRHYYASLLIRHGESVTTVQARLGHTSAAETLNTYAHLWPDSEDRTRDAVDAVLGDRGPFADRQRAL